MNALFIEPIVLMMDYLLLCEEAEYIRGEVLQALLFCKHDES